MNIIQRFTPVLASLSLLAGAGQALATPLIDFTSDNSSFVWYGNNAGCDSGCTLGYLFHVSAPVTIDALGVYDADSNGLNNSHDVGLWTIGGTLLAQTSVGPSSTLTDPSASGSGRYVYNTIGTLTLGAGDYVVGAFYPVGTTDPVAFEASGIFSNDAGTSYTGGRWIDAGAFVFPTQSAGFDRYFGPDLRIASQAPEPASLALFSVALAGLGWRGRARN